MTFRPDLSIVIPFFNEEGNIPFVLQELVATVAALGVTAQLVLVDDGSTDGTAALLTAFARENPLATTICLERNRGQAAALWIGLELATGRWIATLDGDGQNPPRELAKLWSRRAEADLIMGQRARRRDSWLRRAMSRTANATRQLLLNDGVNDAGCALKLFRREVLGSLLPLKTLYSFIPACARAGGWTLIQVPIEHRPRVHGESKYGLGAMAWKPLVDTLALAILLRRTIPRATINRTVTTSAPPGGDATRSSRELD